ncbi:MAG: T9SS type A sorting domain-containing protein [Chitinophagales bacterium]
MKKIFVFLFVCSSFISVRAQNPMQIAECDFDGTLINCEFSFDTAQQNIWQIGTPQKPFFGNAFSAPNAIQTDTLNPYPVNNHSAFTLKFTNNIGYAVDWNRTELSFWHKYQASVLNDAGSVSFSIDNGISWIAMVDTYDIQGANGYGYTFFYWDPPLLQTPNSSLDGNIVSGISSDWVFSSYSWYWYFSVETERDNMTPDTILVRFNFDSDGIFDNYDGWIIDNIKVEKQWYSGIHDPENISGNLHLYPNPASTDINFSLSGNEIAQVQQLINERGEVVKEYFYHNKQGKIVVNDIPKGNYLFKVITSSGHCATQQIVVQ